jgi:hypothetical protein
MSNHNPEEVAPRKTDIGKALLLSGAELRDGLRWMRQHLYVILILMPVVFGITYMTISQAIYDLSALTPPAPVIQLLVAVVCAFGLIPLNLSNASREIYHLRQPAAFAESLPVTKTTHLHFALLMRLGRTVVVGLVLLVLCSLLGRSERIDLSSISALSLFILLAAQAETLAALYWINWGNTRRKAIALSALLVVSLSSVLCGLLILYFVNQAAVFALFSGKHQSSSIHFLYGATLLFAAVVYILTRRSHKRWRAADIDYAQRLGREGSGSLKLPAFLNRSLPRSVSAMLKRDLQLTARVFSSAVYLVGGICLLVASLLVILLTTTVLPGEQSPAVQGWASATWLPQVLVIKAACVLAVAVVSTLLPVLVHYQNPYLWLERSLGVTGQNLLQDKLWYTRCITLPVMLLIYAVGIVAAIAGGNAVPVFYTLPLLAECVWLWWLISSLTGALAFEIPDRPGLSLVLILTVGIAGGGLSAALWIMGVAIYGMGMASLLERGGARARYYLLSEVE